MTGPVAAPEAVQVVRDYLAAGDLEHEEPTPGSFAIVLPGEAKLRTTVSLVVGTHAWSVNAFVVRHADENQEAVYRWLLERNRRLYAVAFCLDHLGDVYLSGRLPLSAMSEAELDRVFGAVLEYADTSFNTLLELGFSGAIRREWAWRVAHDEPTTNLAAFRHLFGLPAEPA